jgi:hypothetical protein
VAFSQSSSDTAKILHWSTKSTVPVITEERDVWCTFVGCSLHYMSNVAFELLTVNIVIISLICYCYLFCLYFRIQINLRKQKGGGSDYCLNLPSTLIVPVI